MLEKTIGVKCPNCKKDFSLLIPNPETRSGIDPIGDIYVYRITTTDIEKFLQDKAKYYNPGANIRINLIPLYCEKRNSKKEKSQHAGYASLRIAFSNEVIEKKWALGLFDSTTDKSVRKFQKLNGLNVDGIVDETTWNKIIEVYKTIPGVGTIDGTFPGHSLKYSSIKSGSSKGEKVVLIQKCLKAISNIQPSIPSPISTDWYESMAESGNVRLIDNIFNEFIRRYQFDIKALDDILRGKNYEFLEHLEDKLGITERYIEAVRRYVRPQVVRSNSNENYIMFSARAEKVIEDMLEDPTSARPHGRVEIGGRVTQINQTTTEFKVFVYPNETKVSEDPLVRELFESKGNKNRW